VRERKRVREIIHIYVYIEDVHKSSAFFTKIFFIILEIDFFFLVILKIFSLYLDPEWDFLLYISS